VPDQADRLTKYLVVSVSIAWTISVLFALYELFYRTVAWPKTAAAIALDMAAAVAITILLMATGDVILLISERYKERRYQEGVAKGLAEGAAKMARKWQDWNNRRLAAESRGEQFDEPTPAVPSTQD
jgi:hypothetical protein